MRTPAILCCVVIIALLGVGSPLGAQPAARAKKARPVQAKPAEKPALGLNELIRPYGLQPAPGAGEASGADGDRAELRESRQSNATSWKLDLTPRQGREADAPVSFRLGRERVVDPVTGQELTPRADPLGAKKSLQEMDLKGAADKLGGKAEVQVDVLKF